MDQSRDKGMGHQVQDMKRVISVFGSTGSIGRSTLDVVAENPDKFEVMALSGHSNIKLLAEQCGKFNPRFAWLPDEGAAAKLRDLLEGGKLRTEVVSGIDAMRGLASDPGVDAVMLAIVGAAGLESAWSACQKGKRLLLANKETLVMAGSLFMARVRESGAELFPVDSEHNAVFQSLSCSLDATNPEKGLESVVITASGGPFWETPREEFPGITPQMAVRHPKWSMGPKISVDSASMMNKALEVIEARWLFDLPHEKIEVLVHPQSVVHGMARFKDGSVIMQTGAPDMRIPISNALAWPKRLEAPTRRIDFSQVGKLEFFAPDDAKFPSLGFARRALDAGGDAPLVLNAANEVAVDAFLAGGIKFPEIWEVVERTLEKSDFTLPESLGELMELDAKARSIARGVVSSLS